MDFIISCFEHFFNHLFEKRSHKLREPSYKGWHPTFQKGRSLQGNAQGLEVHPGLARAAGIQVRESSLAAVPGSAPTAI